jgi:serine/threonine protein kinase
LRQLLEEDVDWDAAIPDAAPILGGVAPAMRGAFAAGTQIGAYTLIRELGQGGMSTVWLAGRSDGQMRRPLALKLPHLFMRTARLAERFEREREILESLSHPNIARLYDAGATSRSQWRSACSILGGPPTPRICSPWRPPLTPPMPSWPSAIARRHLRARMPADSKHARTS